MDRAMANVLYVEDNPVNARLIERVVERVPGVRLTVESTGTAAIAAAREARPDLVLLDLHLPDIAGEAVLAALRGDPGTAGTRIVFLTADAAPATAARLLALGADGILTKPVQVRDVIDLVDSARRLVA